MPSAASPKFAKQYSLFTPNFFVMKICQTLSQEAFVSRNSAEQNGGARDSCAVAAGPTAITSNLCFIKNF